MRGIGRFVEGTSPGLRCRMVLRDATASDAASDADADTVCAALAARTGREAGAIKATLFGSVPRDDAALVTLARDIDTLEAATLGEVRT